MTSLSEKTVYLAGPITGLTYDGAQDWRLDAIDILFNHGARGLSPLRGKQYLRDLGELDHGGTIDSKYASRQEWPLSTPKGITMRDRNDVRTSDAVLANLVGAETVSIGTVMEIAWADAFRTPCIVAMEEGNPHEHSMIQQAAGLIVPTLELALKVVLTVIGREA